MRCKNFLGFANPQRVSKISESRLINLYPIMGEPGDAAASALYMTPGLDFITTVGSGPIRGFTVKQDGSKLLAVSGGGVYSLDSQFTPSFVGNIATPTSPVSIISNDTQTALFDGSAGYIVTTTLTPIVLPFSNPVNAVYQDGFGLVNADGTNNIYQSNYQDLSTWNVLNFGVENAKPDLITAMGDIHREVWVFKPNDIAIWINAGLTGFAFQRLDGVFIEAGLAAQSSLAKSGEQWLWLARNSQGGVSVVTNDGYRPQAVSTDAIDQEINSYPRTDDAVAFSYRQQGHSFYQIRFPSGNASWVYDLTTKGWHQRAALKSGSLDQHWGNASAYFQNKVIVGDYRNGNVYAYNPTGALDNGMQRKWVRSWRAMDEPPLKPVRFPTLAIDMQTGIGVPTVPPVTQWQYSQGAINGEIVAPGGSISVTLPSGIPNGALAAITITFDTSSGATINQVTDERGNIYSAVVDNVSAPVNTQQLATIYRTNIAGLPQTITCTFNGTPGFRGIAVDIFSGANQDAALNTHKAQLVNNPGTGADAISSGSQPVSGSGLCLVYGACIVTGVAGETLSPGTGFTVGQSSAFIMTQYKTVQAPITTQATFKTSIDDIGFLAAMMVFNPLPLPPFTDDPQLMLRHSDDGGYNWSPERYQSAGKIGETAKRIMFTRNGSTRRATGLDRIYELSSTDAFDVALIGASFGEDDL